MKRKKGETAKQWYERQRVEDLLQHVGHKIVCVTYGDGPHNVAIECETCYQVLEDHDVL